MKIQSTIRSQKAQRPAGTRGHIPVRPECTASRAANTAASRTTGSAASCTASRAASAASRTSRTAAYRIAGLVLALFLAGFLKTGACCVRAAEPDDGQPSANLRIAGTIDIPQPNLDDDIMLINADLSGLSPVAPVPDADGTADPAQAQALQAAQEAAEQAMAEALAAQAKAEAEAFASRFTCSVTDPNGGFTFGFRAPQDGIVYLFLPRSVDISSMEILCAGNILGASKGTWDAATGLLSGAFQKSGDTAVLHLADMDVTVKALQSDLPSVQLYLNNTTLETVQTDKNIKYPGNTVYLTGADGTTQLSETDTVEFKGRGNTSWQKYEKKGYQIKFAKKTSVLGMDAAKKWVLLANASDDSMLRNMTAMHLSKELEMAYTTEYQYVDFWIDGIYQGTYIIGEKAEIGGGRLELENEYGVLMEQDSSFYAEEDHWIYDSLLDTQFSLKESVEENDEAKIQYAVASFQQALDRFILYLYRTPADDVDLETLSSMIDVDSFAKYYLISEYLLNREANHSSFYWYKDGEADVLHLGPIWDYDTCMGNEDLDANEYYASIHNTMMNRLLACPVFHDRVNALKSRYSSAFNGLTDYVKKTSRKISSSVFMNYIRWNTLGGTNPKGYSDFAGTYDESLARLTSWLSVRRKAFRVQKPVLSAVPDAAETLITITTPRTGGNLRVAFWSVENGQDDLQWYLPAALEKDRTVFAIDLAPYLSKGLYHVHLYDVTETADETYTYDLIDGTTWYRFP